MLSILLLLSYVVCGTGKIENFFHNLNLNKKGVSFEHVTVPYFSGCDVVVADFKSQKNAQVFDTSLLQYVKKGGNLLLFLESENGPSYLIENVPMVVSDIIGIQDTLTLIGHGIFAGINIRAKPPRLYFTPDTGKVVDYIAVSDSGYMSDQIVCYAMPLGRGTVVVSSLSPEEVGENIFERVVGYFFPDIVLISSKRDSEYINIVENGVVKDSIFIRLCSEDFEGAINAKMVYTETGTGVVVGDSTRVIYSGEFVCERISECDPTMPYNFIIGPYGFYELSKQVSLKISNGGEREVVFITPAGDTVGFVALYDNIGVFPFKLRDLKKEYMLTFLRKLLSIGKKNLEKNAKTVYFRGPASGIIKDINSMRVFTVDGRLVRYFKGDGMVNYNLDALPDGMYIIKLTLKSGRDSILLFNKFQGERQ